RRRRRPGTESYSGSSADYPRFCPFARSTSAPSSTRRPSCSPRAEPAASGADPFQLRLLLEPLFLELLELGRDPRPFPPRFGGRFGIGERAGPGQQRVE